MLSGSKRGGGCGCERGREACSWPGSGKQHRQPMGAEPGATGTWGADGAHGVTTAVPLASGLQWNGFRFCRENANFMSLGHMKTLAWLRQNPGAEGGSVRAKPGCLQGSSCPGLCGDRAQEQTVQLPAAASGSGHQQT